MAFFSPLYTASFFFHFAAPSGTEQVQVTHSSSEILPFRPRRQSERRRRFEMRLIVALKGFNRVLIQFLCSVNSSSALTHKKKTSSCLSLSIWSSSTLSGPERPQPLKWYYILLRQKSWAWKCLFTSTCIGTGAVSVLKRRTNGW